MNRNCWDTSSGIPKKIPIHPLLLSFKGNWQELEENFLAYAYMSSLAQVRFALLLGCFLFAITGAIDAYLIPDNYKWFWVIRYTVVSPMLLALFAFTFSAACYRYMQPFLTICLVSAGGGLVAMIVMAPDAIQQIYHTCLLLALMIGYTILRLRFLYGAFAGWAIFALYLFAVHTFTSLPLSAYITNCLLFVCANLVGMTGCYVMEYFARRNFFLTHLLQDAQEKVKASNRQLEERVSERTKQLMKANTELTKQISSTKRLEEEKEHIKDRLIETQKLEAIGSLAGGIAHDFNNSLGAILGYTDLGRIKCRGNDELIEYFASIRKACLRAKDLVTQISAISWSEQSHSHAIELKLMVKEALKFLQAALPPTIEFSFSFSPELGKITIDPSQAHQVFMAICMNSVEAMGDSGGKLQVHLKEVHADQEMTQRYPDLAEGSYYQQLSISDTGPGIETEILDKIFEPFYTTKSVHDGSGMGLSVVQSIMKRNDGAVSVESTPGKGATFHLFFHAPEQVEQIQEVPAITSLPMAKNHEHILLVDDEETLVAMGDRMLRYLQYEVTTVTSSSAALNLFTSSPDSFDLVITDMAMPTMTGAELAQKILEIRPNLPIVLCTGYAKEWDEAKALDHGFKAFVNKPLGIHKLAQTVSAALDY
jgi:signal transduction histidine kinase/ActR/RegA family two-component response regulator